MDPTFLSQFWPALFSTVVGGVLLTLVFFFLREYVFSMPTVAGVWQCEFIVSETAYNPYKGMKLTHEIVLLQSGDQITGSGEKDREQSALNTHLTYRGKGRTQVKVFGVIEKRVLGSHRVRICWEDEGRIRKSAAFFDLKVSGCKRRGDMVGTGYASAGKCSGYVTWRRVSI